MKRGMNMKISYPTERSPAVLSLGWMAEGNMDLLITTQETHHPGCS
jgi:hypothetical protein